VDEVGAVLIGAVFGGLLTFLFQTYYEMINEDVTLLNDFIADLMDIEDVAVEYWLADDKDARAQNLADTLRGRFHATGFFREDAPRLLKGDFLRYTELDGLIYDTAMGGDFQTEAKTRDPAIAVQVMRYSRELRALIRRARRKRYWAN
jgi:hypothetical protein